MRENQAKRVPFTGSQSCPEAQRLVGWMILMVHKMNEIIYPTGHHQRPACTRLNAEASAAFLASLWLQKHGLGKCLLCKLVPQLATLRTVPGIYLHLPMLKMGHTQEKQPRMRKIRRGCYKRNVNWTFIRTPNHWKSKLCQLQGASVVSMLRQIQKCILCTVNRLFSGHDSQ